MSGRTNSDPGVSLQYRINVTGHPTVHVHQAGVMIDPARDYNPILPILPGGVPNPPSDTDAIWLAMLNGLTTAGFAATLERVDVDVTDLEETS